MVTLTRRNGPTGSLHPIAQTVLNSQVGRQRTTFAGQDPLDDDDRPPESSSDENDEADIAPTQFTTSSFDSSGAFKSPAALTAQTGRKRFQAPSFVSRAKESTDRPSTRSNQPSSQRSRGSQDRSALSQEEFDSEEASFLRCQASKPTATYSKTPKLNGSHTLGFKRPHEASAQPHHQDFRSIKPNSRESSMNAQFQAPHSAGATKLAAEPKLAFRTPTVPTALLRRSVPERRVVSGTVTRLRSARIAQQRSETSPEDDHEQSSSARACSSSPTDDAIAKLREYDRLHEDEAHEGLDAGPVCPMCGVSVDGKLLEDFEDGMSMVGNLKRQRRFCLQHRKSEAWAVWKGRGYPDIQWETLATECEVYLDEIRAIIVGEKSSSFHDAVQLAYEEGSSRTVHQALNRNEQISNHSITPGYYGFRGSELL